MLSFLSRPHRPTDSAVPLIVTVAGFLAFVSFSLGQWRSFQSPSWDLAIFSQLAKAYSHMQAPIVPIKGADTNLLGDHFHPILIVLGPLWRLAPTPLTLLIVQDLLIAVSAWPISRLACRILGHGCGIGLGLLYVLSWGFQSAVAAQFHEIAFAVPLLAWASVAFVERHWYACALWSLPLVLVKEDLGLTVAVIGLVIAWRADRRPAQKAGLALFGAGLLAFILTVGVILPALSPSGTWEYGINGNLGDGSATSATTPPLLITRLVWPPIKLVTLALLVTTMGVIGLRSPWTAVVLPTLAWRFLSTKEAYWDWSLWHYNAVLMPIAVGSLLDVIAQQCSRLHPLPLQSVTRSSITHPPLQIAATAHTHMRILRSIAVVLPALALAWAAPSLPLAALTRPDWGDLDERTSTAHAIIDLIPADATVSSDLGLLAYLVPHTTVHWVGTDTGITPEYVVIDARSGSWGAAGAPTDAAIWEEERTGAQYDLIINRDGYQVAKRTH